MAPPTRTRPSALPLKSALKKRPETLPPASSSSLAFATEFPTTKKDKRHIKHANLLSKVKKSSTSTSEAQRNKRRRQKKQLVANLVSLADALPADGEDANTVRAGSTRGNALREQANIHLNLIQRKSMKSRPGALKRREKIDKGERERFARNLAEMSGKKPADIGENAEDLKSEPQVHNRWAALRGFIAQTMEQRPEMTNLNS